MERFGHTLEGETADESMKVSDQSDSPGYFHR